MVKVVKDTLEKGDDLIEGTVSKYSGKQHVDRFAKSKTGKNVGSWAFIIGFVIALAAGIVAGLNAMSPGMVHMDVTSLMMGVLVFIGVIVGIVNVSSSETIVFLVCAMAIMLTPSGFGALNALPGMGVIAAFLSALTGMMAVFVAPAAIIVALKGIYSTARKA